MGNLKSTPTTNNLFQKPDHASVDWDIDTNNNWDQADFYINRPYRNRVINGAFMINQRGNDGAVVSGDFTADRWKHTFTTGALQIIHGTNYSITPFKILRAVCSTPADFSDSAAHVSPYVYTFEGNQLFDLAKTQKNITISFIARAEVPGVYAAALRNNQVSASAGSYVTEINLTQSPVRYSITIPLAGITGSPVSNDTNRGYTLTVCAISGADYQAPSLDTWLDGNYFTSANGVNWMDAVDNYVEIAEVQVEEGDIATRFEVVPYDVELQRCKRYYEKGNMNASVAGNTAAVKVASMQFSVEKRGTATMDFTFSDSSSIDVESVINTGFNIQTSGSWVDGRTNLVWIADAEL